MPLSIEEAKNDLDDMYREYAFSVENNTEIPEWVETKSNEWGIGVEGVGAWGETQTLPIDDETRVAVRNQIYEDIGNNIPEGKESVGWWDRTKMMNLVDERPDLQQQYLSKRGFESKVEAGKTFFRRPGMVDWNPVDPSGFDWFDITDSVDEFADMAAELFAVSARVAGRVTGPMGMVAGPVAAGTATAITEFGKQSLANIPDPSTGGIRMQEGFDIGEMGEKFLEGATGEITGKALDWITFKPMRKLFGEKPSIAPDIEDTLGAESVLDIELPPGKKMGEESIQRIREAKLIKSGARSNKQLKHQIDQIQEAKDSFIKDIESEMIEGKTDVAVKFRNSLEQELEKNLKPLEDLYSRLDFVFDDMVEKGLMEIDNDTLEAFLKDVADRSTAIKTGSESIKPVFDRILEDARNVDTIKGGDKSVTALRTSIRKLKKLRPNDEKLNDALDEAYEVVTAFRSDQLKELTEEFPDELSGGIFGPSASEALKDADAKYRELQVRFKRAFKTRKAQDKANAQTMLEEFKELDPQKLFNDLSGNVENLDAMKNTYPEAFESIRSGIIGELYRTSKKGVKTPTTEDLLNKIFKMDQSKKHVIFGSSERARQDALVKVINKMDERFLESPHKLRSFLNTSSKFLNTLPIISGMTELGRANLYEFQLTRLARKLAVPLAATGTRGFQTAVGTAGLMEAFSPRESRGLQKAMPQDPLSITPSLGGR